jgi:tetratricopeptide (TPR) repeat protein
MSMRARFPFVLFFFILVPVLSPGQSLKAYLKVADQAYADGDLNAAIFYYQYILKKDPNNRKAIYKYADCSRAMFAYPIAEKYFLSLAKGKKEPTDFDVYHLRLAQVYRGQGKYQDALESYQKYLRQAQPNTELHALAQREVDQTIWAINASQSNRQEIQVIHLSKSINSAYSDFAPSMVSDTLFYSSYRFKRKKDKSKPKRMLTKVLYSVAGKKSKEATQIFGNQDSLHIAHTAFFGGGKYLIYTACEEKLGKIRCDLFLTVRDEKNKWKRGIKLPEGINTAGFTSTQPSLSYDSVSQNLMLLFASDRPEGMGGLDLYRVNLDTAWFCPCKSFKSNQQFDLPAFGKCEPLTPLNTVGNDATPYFQNTSQTYWFSSDARSGFGAYDIYTALMLDDSAKIENAGQPMNSPYNDLYPLPTSDGKSGYFTSNRLGSMYLNAANKACCNDLYSWQRTETPMPKPKSEPRDSTTTVIVPPVSPDLPIKPTLPTVLPNLSSKPLTPAEQLKTFVGLPLYFDNDEPDKRTTRSTSSKTFEQTVTKYLAREAEYGEKFAEGAKTEDAIQEAQASIEAFFANEVRDGYDRLFELTELIHERLLAGERIEVFVKGFTSPRAKSDYNLQLGHRRISSVRNHFIDWQAGTLKAFLDSGQFLVTEASFGETTASTSISDNLKDEKNSIFNPEAARERRVEIIEIKTH